MLLHMKRHFTFSWLLALTASFIMLTSCDKDDDPQPELIAGFSFQVDMNNYKRVVFDNASQGFTSVTWNFGDGTPTSTEENPVHIYANDGVYTVTLTASNGTETDVQTQQVTIADLVGPLNAIAGATSKSWKLLRTVRPGRWPLEVGPFDRSTVWWGLGRDNQDILIRPCTMNDEFIFYRDGRYEYKSNGDFWAEGGVFEPANECFETTPANLVGPGGANLSAFGDGIHSYTLGSNQLTLMGLGAFIGLQKIGTDAEVSMPQLSTRLDIVKLSEGPTDTLILESNWKFAGNTSGTDDAYWRITLVHYNNAGDEPPVVGFNADVAVNVATFTNRSYDATTYLWDFGDGQMSTEANPVHTYSNPGVYTVRLTGTRGTATASSEVEVTISGGMTANDLVGGAWRIRNAALSIFVGPGLGNPDWWQVPANYLDGSSTGVDDWSCMTDDEWIFSANGTYEYKTNGDARNDGYMGSPNGCWDDAQIAASGNGAAFGSGVHGWSFTPASGSPSGRPVITVTNGVSGAAFLGFYKGYYGGENSDGANPPNGGSATNQYEVMSYVNDGTNETLTISVDFSAAHDGSMGWTMVLVR